jgi:DeoR family suf operon transcriptional repressor
MWRKKHNSAAAQQLAGKTQWQVLLLLCQKPQTVNELAAALELTDNAVRAQLETLTAGGLVQQTGWRPGVRRPHAEYGLTERAANLFPKAYEPAFRAVVDVLTERLPEAERRAVLRETGRRLLRQLLDSADIRPDPSLPSLLKRIEGAEIGVQRIDEPERTVLQSCTCPLSAVTRDHPEICAIAAELLSELTGVQVRERCVKGDSPRCTFDIKRGTTG